MPLFVIAIDLLGDFDDRLFDLLGRDEQLKLILYVRQMYIRLKATGRYN